jgi:hypothetical protein
MVRFVSDLIPTRARLTSAHHPSLPGEFGPVFATEAVDGPSWKEINDSRYAALGEQMAVYNQDRISWTIWLYKDIGIQGMVHAKQDSPWIKLFGAAIARKRKLALEFWGTDEWVAGRGLNGLP